MKGDFTIGQKLGPAWV